MAYKRKREGKSQWLAPALSAGFGAGAAALGYGAFAPAASAFGGFLGQKFKDITGYGDYTIRKNTLMSGEVPSVGNPTWTSNGLTISHREYLGDVVTSPTIKTFAISDFHLNPNNAQTWEWLTQIACNYEEWVPEGILFYYKSTSGDALNSVDTSLGTVIMATNYNPYNKPFTTKAEMQSYEYSTSGPPNQDMLHMIECDPSEGSIATYFMSSVNTNPDASGSMDLRFNTMGTFYIATTGFQGTNVNIGELWVTYQVTLLKPKLYQSLGLAEDSIYVELGPSSTNNQDSALGIWPITSSALGTTQKIYQYTIPYTSFTPSDSLWVANKTGGVDIHWPVYAFETYYKVVLIMYKSGSLSSVGITPTHFVGTGLAPPTTVGNYVNAPGTPATTTLRQIFVINVRVPGGYVCNTPATTPYTSIAISTPSTVNWSWDIKQIPAMDLISYVVDPE